MRNILNKGLINDLFLIILLIVIPTIDVFYPIPHKEYFITTIGLWGLYVLFLEKIHYKTFTKIDKVICCFVLYELFHFFIFSKNNITSIHLWKRISIFLLFLILRMLFLKNKKIYFNKLLIVLILKVLLEVTIGVLQYLKIVNSNRSEFFEIIGTFTTPNFYACVLVCGCIIGTWLILFKKPYNLSIIQKIISPIIGVLIIILLISTKSRAALIGLFISSSLLLLIKYKHLIQKLSTRIKVISVLIIGTIIIIGSYFVYNLKKDSANGRVLIAKISLQEIKKQPIFGHGLFSFGADYNKAKSNYFNQTVRDWNEIKIGDYIPNAMNDFLEVFFETGVVGILFLISILLITFKETSYKNQNSLLGLAILLYMIVTAALTSVSRSENLITIGVIGFILAAYTNITVDTKKNRSTIKSLFIKGIVGVCLLSSTIIGVTKLYTKKLISEHISSDIKMELSSKETWRKWRYITSDGGLSDFKYGKLLYNHFNIKPEGLKIMKMAIEKNNDPMNIRKLAKYYNKEKKYTEVEKLLKLNIGIEPFLFKPKMNLLRFYIKNNRLEYACKLANEIIKFPVKVPSSEIDRYKKITRKILKKHSCGKPKKEDIKKNKSPSVDVEIVFGGDIDFGDRYHKHKKRKASDCIIKEKGYANSFSEISPLLKSGDLLVANLETPISEKIENNKLDSIKKYLHWCKSKEALGVLESLDFDYLSLANNHTLDQGTEGLQKTFDYLSKSNIIYFGAGKNEIEASKPVLIKSKLSRNIYLIGGFEYRDWYEFEYDYYAQEAKPGINEWNLRKAEEQIKKIKNKDPKGLIIAFPHWGANYKWKNQEQEDLAEVLISAGTDLIIGHGAHKFQEIEKNDRNWIFYSLGNLVMNSPGRYKSKKAMPYSFIVKLKISELNNNIKMETKIYPIFSNNRVSKFKPYFVSRQEMYLIKSALIDRIPYLSNKLKINGDNIGYYFSLSLD